MAANITLESDELKRLARIDDDDMLLNAKAYQGAAEQFLVNSGCMVDYDNALFKSLVIAIVVRMLDQPDLVMGTNSNDLSFSLVSMVTQLRLQQQAESSG